MTSLLCEAIFGEKIITESRNPHFVNPNGLVFPDNLVKIKLSCRGHSGRGNSSIAIIDREFTKEKIPYITDKNQNETETGFICRILGRLTGKKYLVYCSVGKSIKADLIIAECGTQPKELKKGGMNKKDLVMGSERHHNARVNIEGNKPLCYSFDDRLISSNNPFEKI